MKKFTYALLATLLFLSGCATNQGPTYDGRSYTHIKKYEVGTILSLRPVVITDDGSGQFFGILIGTVLGSFIGGRGRGSILPVLAGGFGGYYVGREISKANGAELTVKLDSGEEIIVVVKGNNFVMGNHIKIIKDGNRVAGIDVISE
ncbi:MAG: outer membrane lipoprotein SlyB [Sulfurimonas sp.]|jgi:outer membrane lipoprotein SlyB